jgi:hypothetical protein
MIQEASVGFLDEIISDHRRSYQVYAEGVQERYQHRANLKSVLTPKKMPPNPDRYLL